MSDETPELGREEAGCARRECQNGHTRRWGRCAYGIEPAPTLTQLEVMPGPDGHPSLVQRSLDAGEVAEWLRGQGYVSWVDLTAERDQLKAAVDRVKTLATNAARTECGAGWNLDPAEVLAALDQSKEPT